MNTSGFFSRAWRWVKWPVLVLIFLYAVLVGFRTFMLFDEEKTAEAVAAIHAQKITLADVLGTNLPPVPDQAENDATVVGIDKNNNGIRDDVELAIFKKYPNDKKTRAGQLQYAKALQMELERVFNSETLVAVIQQEGRAYICMKGEEETIENLVFNTEKRKERQKAIYDKYTTSYSLPNSDFCDISPEALAE